jgi:cyclophilin family peptidyl-prolyl cis-trans isomerase
MRRLILAALVSVAAFAQAADNINPRVVLETSAGIITLELFARAAPISCANFIEYVRSGFYADTIFHRVVPDFVIQGGGFTIDMTQKPTRDPIKNEADNGLANERGTLSMARRPDPGSATSQFFVNLADNAFLDHQAPTAEAFGYAVFARVVEGMDVVDRIAAGATGVVAGMPDVPLEPVTIVSATVIDAAP